MNGFEMRRRRAEEAWKLEKGILLLECELGESENVNLSQFTNLFSRKKCFNL